MIVSRDRGAFSAQHALVVVRTATHQASGCARQSLELSHNEGWNPELKLDVKQLFSTKRQQIHALQEGLPFAEARSMLISSCLTQKTKGCNRILVRRMCISE